MKEGQVNDCVIFECFAGSIAYGTNTAHSDTDIRGVCIPKDHSYYIGIGLNRFEQKDSWEGDDDKVIYDLRKIVSLMADNNPNCLELLFTDPKHYIKCESEWQKLIDNRDLFLSKKVRWSYAGYAFSQAKRIKRHRNYLLSPPKKKPIRSEFGLPDRKLISSDQKGAYQWLIARILEDTIEYMNLSDQTKAELNKVNLIGCIQSDLPDDTAQVVKELTGATDEWVDVTMREKRYAKALKDWNAYQDWKANRNYKRKVLEDKYGYDLKHASHLVRLFRQGIEILEGKGLQVYRPDAKELLAIRNGAWTYEQLEEYAEKSEEKMKALYETSTLQKEPQRTKIDKLCQEIIGSYVFGL